MLNTSTKPRFPGLGIDQVWLYVILAGFAFYVSLVPLPPNDFWWHLKIGELTYTQGKIPAANLFAWSLPADTPFYYGAWLGEYLLYVLYRWGGLALPTFARNVMIVLTFWLAASEAKRRSGSWRLAALAVALVCLASLNNLIIRPQNWSWLPFVAFFILLSRYADGQLKKGWLLALPLIMAFWVNAHGAFITGLVMLGIFVIGEALRRLFKLEGARSWLEVGWLAGVGVITGLSTVINPRFLGIFGYVLDLMTDKPSQRLIQEWQSPTPEGIPNTIFFAIVLALLVIWIYTRYRPSPTHVLLMAAFLWLAWSGQRYVIWFGLIAIPILAEAVGKLPIKTPTFVPQKNWLNLAIVVLVFVPVLAVQPWLVENVPLPQRYWDLVYRGIPEGPLIGVSTPIPAVEYLKQHPGGRLYNEMGYGSYLIWALPEQSIFIDPRVELYPFEQWEDYIRINRGTNYNALLARYGADRLLLDKDLQKELIGLLNDDPLWKLEYEDDRAQIWNAAR